MIVAVHNIESEIQTISHWLDNHKNRDEPVDDDMDQSPIEKQYVTI